MEAGPLGQSGGPKISDTPQYFRALWQTAVECRIFKTVLGTRIPEQLFFLSTIFFMVNKKDVTSIVLSGLVVKLNRFVRRCRQEPCQWFYNEGITPERFSQNENAA